MTCVCRGQWLVMEKHGHEGPTRIARELRTIESRVPQLQPTVFVDAIPELAAERRRRLTELYRNDAA